MSPSSENDWVDRVKAAVYQERLQQLQSFTCSSTATNGSSSFAVPTYFGVMKRWSEQAKEQIWSAVEARACGVIIISR